MPARLPQRGGIFHQCFPQRRLPVLRLPQTFHGFSRFPLRKPVRPINQILIEQVGGARGKLKEFAFIGVVGQIMAQQYKLILIQQLRQQGHQFPAHALFAESAFFGDIRQHADKHLPDKTRR
ncbi:Uncharacterised protein [Salmonella enterica subsp. enterica serovar Bovismorbificans]|nr:Uncharacterised protein [Salmonella enterica subsp. enterica serovar Bovismorbificans]CQB63041.1 Uncharacterised protein [Salmonella enterica subsp. enterica serovar Bovismorbificans]